MSEEEITREIKPRSEIPASHEDITSDIPERTLSTSLASDLIGMRQAHFKKVVRESLDESIGSTATLQQIADVYSISRPNPSILSQRHFTTEEGMDGLISLIEYLESDGGDRADSLDINTVYQGSCLDHFREFPEESVQTVITSPPYWGMRVYSKEFNIDWSDGTTSAFGGESTPEQYIRNTLELFLRMRPILKDTGTIWWNVGDVYNTRTEIRETSLERMTAVATNEERTWADLDAKRHSAGHEYLKDKDLTLIPYQIAKKADSYASDLDYADTREPLSQEERDVKVKSTLKTTYSMFDTDIDPREDAIEAITEDYERNLLMVGPPGTGKTYESFEIADELGEETFFFQFHESYSYEDFVEAYEPTPVAEGGVEFEPVAKGFRKACEAADETDEYVFVILDEINRANVSRVFGELFSLIEYRESITEKGVEQRMLYSDEPLVIPNNLVIMATMNNLDKSTEDMEFALRRRFAQITVPPSTEALRDLLSGQVGPDELDELCLLLNSVIEDGEYPLGHTYFKDIGSIEELTKLYRRRIRPSVKEYHGEYRREQLEMIDDMFQKAARMELSDTS